MRKKDAVSNVFFKEFMSDIRHAFGFLQRDGDKEALNNYVKENRKTFSELRESTYNLLSVMSRCSRLKAVKKNVEKEGRYNMCEAIEGIYQDGKREGLRDGRREGKLEGKREGKREERRDVLIMLLEKLGHVTEEFRMQILQESDMNILKGWMVKAMDATSMEEFMQSVNGSEV